MNVLSKVDLLSQRNKELLETFLETDVCSILDNEETSPWNEKYRQLSRTIAEVLDDYSLVCTLLYMTILRLVFSICNVLKKF